MSDRHFELTDETHDHIGRTLHRIRATTALPRHGVVEGDLGGWVETADNLSGNAWVFDNAWVFGNAKVSDDAEVSDNAQVSDDAEVSGNAQVSGNAGVSGDARVSGDAEVSGNAEVSGSAEVSGNAKVSGDARVFGNAEVSGDAAVSGNAWVSGGAVVTEGQDILVVHPIGSESATATLTRTRDGHQLSVWCWRDRTIDQLDAEVERRSESWRGSPADHDRWRAEYRALRALCEARIAGWETR